MLHREDLSAERRTVLVSETSQVLVAKFVIIHLWALFFWYDNVMYYMYENLAVASMKEWSVPRENIVFLSL